MSILRTFYLFGELLRLNVCIFWLHKILFLRFQKVYILIKVTRNIKGENVMFEIRKTEEMINKTFRLPASLLDELTQIAEHEKISVNNLVRQCCEYALGNMKKEKWNKEYISEQAGKLSCVCTC